MNSPHDPNVKIFELRIATLCEWKLLKLRNDNVNRSVTVPILAPAVAISRLLPDRPSAGMQLQVVSDDQDELSQRENP